VISVMLALAAAGRLAERADPPLLQIDVVLCQGDPLGSRVEGTMKYLAEPRVVTQSGRLACFRSGGPEAILGGTSGITGPGVQLNPAAIDLEILPVACANGKVGMEVRGTHREARPGGADQKLRFSRFVTPGEKIRFRIAADSPSSQTWAEVTVTEYRPEK
jgi:hypothetical protein